MLSVETQEECLIKMRRYLRRALFLARAYREAEPGYSIFARKAYREYSHDNLNLGGHYLALALQDLWGEALSEELLRHWISLLPSVLGGRQFSSTCEQEEFSIQPQIILYSGFGYTGSSAVHEFVATKECVEDAVQGREIDLVKFDFGLYDLAREYRHASEVPNDTILKFIFIHVFGLPVYKFINFLEIEKNLVQSKSLVSLLLRQHANPKVHIKFLDLLVSIFSSKNYPDFLSASRVFLSNICDLREGSSNVNVINCNNWVPGYQIEAFTLFPENSKIVVVRRCWADSYCSWASESRGFARKLGFLYFLPFFWVRTLIFTRRISKLEMSIRNRIVLIDFENFILHESEREKLLEVISLGRVGDSGYFSLESSRRNIGIFRRRFPAVFFVLRILNLVKDN